MGHASQQVVFRPDSDLATIRANAKRTVSRLIAVHQQTIKEIDEGKVYWKRGEDVSANIRRRCEYEIKACHQVLEAIETMKAGDVKRAAGLCEQIEANLPRVN